MVLIDVIVLSFFTILAEIIDEKQIQAKLVTSKESPQDVTGVSE